DGSLSQWHKATYDAIRGAGNNSPILIEPGGSRPGNLTAPLDLSVYTGMTSIIADPHVYGYQNDFNSSPASLTANVQGMITAAQQIKSADGTVPVIIGEFGNSTDGSTADPNCTVNIQAVLNSGVGSAAWSWVSGGSDALRNSDGSLTADFGQPVATFIKASGNQGCAQSPIPTHITAPSLQAEGPPTAPSLRSVSSVLTAPSLVSNPMSIEQVAAM